MTTAPPKWITPFFFATIIAALLALVLVFVWHDAGQPELSDHAVADLTINLGGQPVREHCTTCHPNGSRPDPANLALLIRPHPDIGPHRIDQLGCTACHLGEGMALDREISHGLPGLGGRTVLTGHDLQATCFRCHPAEPLPGAEKAWDGYSLFFAKACNTCHATSEKEFSGFYGPDLSDIGNILGLNQIQTAILEPRKDLPNSKMPRFPVSKRQAREISYFLKSRMGTPLYTTPLQGMFREEPIVPVDLVPAGKTSTEGEKLLYQTQCLACHKFRQADGRIAPDLTYIGRQREPDYLSSLLDNPTRLVPGSAMPRIPMDETVRNQLVDFLSSQAVGPVQAIGGKHLYMQLCQRCHAAGGDGQGPIQPNLVNFPRAFNENAEFFRAVSDQRLVDSLSHGIPGTSMPGFEKLLGKEQMDHVLDLIFAAFIGLDRDDKIRLAPLPKRPERLASKLRTEELFAQNCVRCHGAFGTGAGPEALKFQPRPRNLRNHRYFEALPDQRIVRAIHDGIPGTAMPAFGDHLSDVALWSLASKVRAFSGTQKDQ